MIIFILLSDRLNNMDIDCIDDHGHKPLVAGMFLMQKIQAGLYGWYFLQPGILLMQFPLAVRS